MSDILRAADIRSAVNILRPSPKVLLAVMSCHSEFRQCCINAQRATWVPAVRALGVDVVFFKGRVTDPYREPLVDEEWLDVPDDYLGIVHKVRAIMAWGVAHGYDIIAKCDDDVYICPERFKHLPIGPDYVGRFRGPYGHSPVHFASGFLYWLTRKAATIVAGAEYNGDWMDERFVSTVLAYNRIWGHNDPHGYAVTGPHIDPEDVMRNRALNGAAIYCEYGPEKMERMHRIFKDATARPTYDLEPVPRMAVTEAIYRMAPKDEAPAHKVKRGAR